LIAQKVVAEDKIGKWAEELVEVGVDIETVAEIELVVEVAFAAEVGFGVEAAQKLVS
jgi:hypothetical protein